MRGQATAAAGVDFGDRELAALVRARLVRIADSVEAELGGNDEIFGEMAAGIVRSGERPIRPLIAVLSAQLGSEPDSWQVTAAGAATEMVHLATLHHDDVADGAHGGTDDRSADRWRNSVAILAGDYLLAAASRLLSRLGPAAVETIAETFGRMTEGQMRVRCIAQRRATPADQSLRVFLQRTGSLITTAGRFGALFGGVPRSDIERVTRLSATVGIALQISDDVVDITATDPRGDVATAMHLSKRLHALPVLYALGEPGPRTDRLRDLLFSSDHDGDTQREAFSLVRASGGTSKATRVAIRYAARARSELHRLPVSGGSQALGALADYVAARHA